jgi:hypothetical protein
MTATDINSWVAAGWTVDNTTVCTGDAPGTFINTNPNHVVGPRLIIFKCGSNLPVNLNGANTHDITLNQDTALVSDTGFAQSNNIAYHGSGVTSPDRWTLYWIVPSSAAGVSWVNGGLTPSCAGMTGAGQGNISLDQMKIDGLNWFVYTPCSFILKNGNNLTGNTIPLTGQVYAGSVQLPTSANLQMQSISVPSLASGTPTPNDPANMRLTSRFDLRDGNVIP